MRKALIFAALAVLSFTFAQPASGHTPNGYHYNFDLSASGNDQFDAISETFYFEESFNGLTAWRNRIEEGIETLDTEIGANFILSSGGLVNSSLVPGDWNTGCDDTSGGSKPYQIESRSVVIKTSLLPYGEVARALSCDTNNNGEADWFTIAISTEGNFDGQWNTQADANTAGDNQHDLRGVATHEAGHVAFNAGAHWPAPGAADQCRLNSSSKAVTPSAYLTMCEVSPFGTTEWRSLEHDDIAELAEWVP